MESETFFMSMSMSDSLEILLSDALETSCNNSAESTEPPKSYSENACQKRCSSNQYWEKPLPSKIISDVRSGHLDAKVAASILDIPLKVILEKLDNGVLCNPEHGTENSKFWNSPKIKTIMDAVCSNKMRIQLAADILSIKWSAIYKQKMLQVCKRKQSTMSTAYSVQPEIGQEVPGASKDLLNQFEYRNIELDSTQRCKITEDDAIHKNPTEMNFKMVSSNEVLQKDEQALQLYTLKLQDHAIYQQKRIQNVENDLKEKQTIIGESLEREKRLNRIIDHFMNLNAEHCTKTTKGSMKLDNNE